MKPCNYQSSEKTRLTLLAESLYAAIISCPRLLSIFPVQESYIAS